MANVKISALPAATSVTTDDLVPMVNDPGGGSIETQKATITQVATYVRGTTGTTTATNLVGNGTELSFNTAGAAMDTRIAGSSQANLVFVKASTNYVGIGTNSPTQKLDVNGTAKATTLTGSGASLTGIGTTATNFTSLASDPGSPANGDVWYNTTTGLFKCAVNVSGTPTIKTFTMA
jgi:hypothetical protein